MENPQFSLLFVLTTGAFRYHNHFGQLARHDLILEIIIVLHMNYNGINLYAMSHVRSFTNYGRFTGRKGEGDVTKAYNS